MGPIFILTLGFPFIANAATAMFISFFENSGAGNLTDNFLPLMPMIVGFFPISISLVIALETFVGEKERRSIEPLLSTPLTNTELYIGKTLAAMIPPLLASYTGIALYIGGLVFGDTAWRPDLELVIQIVVLTTGQALVMVTGAVVISGQTTSTRAANLLASFIIIPISLLVMLESYIMITNNRYVLWYIVIGMFIVDIILFTAGARLFNREELLGRQLDTLNLGWAWRTFRERFIGGAKTPVMWVRGAWGNLKILRRPAVVIVGTIIFMFAGGYGIAQVRTDYQFPVALANRARVERNLNGWLDLFAGRPETVMTVLSNNIRVITLATLLAVFSFGVLGVVVVSVPFGILGFLLGQPIWGELNVTTYFSAVVLHTLLEAPAAIIGAAAALRLGLSFIQPQEEETVAERFLRALADCTQWMFAVVIPLLIVAGLLEVYVTPLLVQQALK